MPRLTVDLLCRCTGHASKRRRDETQEQFLARVTHLYCSEKGVEHIENIHLCHSLSVLYLYDNQISKINEFGNHTPLLTHLYLQNNLIAKMENLHMLHHLTKLYLNHNSIRVVEGLETLTQLLELHVAHQNLPDGEKLLIDPRSIKGLANNLTVLNVSGNQLDTLEDLASLSELQQVMASENQLTSMKSISKVLSRWVKLWKLDLHGNPLSSKHKYRDRVVTMCHKLESLDSREVSEMERQFLFSWKAMRKARNRHMIQKAMSFSGQLEVLDPPAAPPYATPTMPPLPARQPIRVHLLQQKRKQQMEQKRIESDLHLPQIVTDKRAMLTGVATYGQIEPSQLDVLKNKDITNRHIPNIFPIFT